MREARASSIRPLTLAWQDTGCGRLMLDVGEGVLWTQPQPRGTRYGYPYLATNHWYASEEMRWPRGMSSYLCGTFCVKNEIAYP